MERSLVIVSDADLYYFPAFAGDRVFITQLFSGRPGRLFNALRKLCPPLARFRYGPWKNQLDGYDRIVVMDVAALMDTSLFSFLRSCSASADIFIYSWNMDLSDGQVKILKEKAERYSCGLYSYDEGFCARHGFTFNTIMFDAGLRCPPVPLECDAVYLGLSKDRLDVVERVARVLTQAGLQLDFTVVGPGAADGMEPYIKQSKNYVPYQEYLLRIYRSRAIVDIAQHGQLGYSMRVMESIFYDKKLITTNPHVVDAPFFKYGNVLVLDECTSLIEVKEFMARPTAPYGDEIRRYYSVEAWADRFI